MKIWRSSLDWNSIHARLLSTYLLLITLGTSLMAGYILWSFHGYFMRTKQSDLADWTTALSESVADALEQQDVNQVKLLTQRYGAPQSVTLRIFASDGRLLATSAPEVDRYVADWLSVPGMQEALHHQSVQGITKGVLSHDDRIYIARPIIRKGKTLGVLRISITIAQFQHQFIIIIWTVLGTLCLTIFLGALLSNRFARSLSTPIAIMQQFAMRLGSGNFGDKLSIRQNNELDQLAIELNRMSERLASLEQERRAFLANVSHELRTPISNISVTIDALRCGADAEPALRDRFLQTADDETKRLSRLIHDLLDLGRLEAGVVTLERQPFSLRALIDRAVRAVEPRMQELGVSVQQKVIDISVQGDSERLLQAFLNILDNAIKHSPANSTVAITAYRSAEQLIIQVQDQGNGINESDLPRIFEQFYTADASRKGTGLGLTIAKRIVEAHQGSILVYSHAGQGATFRIYLPLR